MAGIGSTSLLSDLTDLLPTPARLYWDTVVKRKKDPITEADFSPAELQAMQSLIGVSQINNQADAGGVGYQHYDPESQPGLMGLFNAPGRVANSLGQFNYQQTPEGSLITDKYDFNPMFKNESMLNNALIGAGTLGFSPMHLLGEYLVPPGTGRDVKIKLPKRKPDG